MSKVEDTQAEPRADVPEPTLQADQKAAVELLTAGEAPRPEDVHPETLAAMTVVLMDML